MDHQIQAQRWINDHPRAMNLFEQLAMSRVQLRQRFGAKALVEAVRWHYAIERTDQDAEWKLNNNYTAYIARWLIAKHPEIAGFIELRHVGGQDRAA
jgi:predicted acetyltransferase